MANVENLKIGNTSYGIRDKNTYRSLSSAQATTLLSNGTYEGVDVDSGEIFTCDDGAIKKYTSTSTYDANFTTGGGVTITDGVATFPSGGAVFSDYTFNPSSNTWKIKFSFTPQNLSPLYGDYQVILGFGDVGITATAGKKIHLYISGITDSYGQTSLTNGVKYDLELSFTGTEYVLKIKESTAIEWTTDITVSSSSTVSSGAFTIGAEYKYGSYYNYWKGSIDLNDFTAEINNEVVWTPYENVYTRTLTTLTGIKLTDITQAGTGIKFKEDDVIHYTLSGTPTVSSSYIASNFSESDKILPTMVGFNQTFQQLAHNQPWEFKTKINLSTLDTFNAIFGGECGSWGCDFYVNSSNKIAMNLSSNGGGYDISGDGTLYGTTTLAANTDYWVKCGWTGTEYYAEISTDGVNWTSGELSLTSSTAVYASGYATYIGARCGGYFHGSIDLSETSFDFNNGQYKWSVVDTGEDAITLDIATNQGSAPSTSTEGYVGKLYITSGGAVYICTGVSGSTYTWSQITVS